MFQKGQKQMYFIEFFGPQVERAWLSQDCIFRYKGIESFKIYAQDQVDRAISKSVKEKLAERFQLKVALNRRDQWEQAIEQADLYLKKQESIHDINTGRSKSRLADSLAKLNQINEEKMINSTNLATSKKKVQNYIYDDKDMFLMVKNAKNSIIYSNGKKLAKLITFFTRKKSSIFYKIN